MEEFLEKPRIEREVKKRRDDEKMRRGLLSYFQELRRRLQENETPQERPPADLEDP